MNFQLNKINPFIQISSSVINYLPKNKSYFINHIQLLSLKINYSLRYYYFLFKILIKIIIEIIIHILIKYIVYY